MSDKFKRVKEDFSCTNCGQVIIGNGFTDHCPNCLYSKHVDINPGDRASTCNGLMKPTGISPAKNGYVISYKCVTCGYEHNNKSSDDDNITDFITSLGTIESQIERYDL